MEVDACLDRLPQEGARVVALALRQEAAAAAKRLDDAADDEALHDFRVALRRMRSILKAWSPWVEDTLRRRTLRRLRKVARATGAARDAEVQILWLAERRARIRPEHAAAFDWLMERLEQRRHEGYARARATAASKFRRVSKRLLRELSRYGVDLSRREDAGTFASAAARLVRDQAKALRNALGKVRSASHVTQAHAARIEAKRLRYLLEPFRGCRAADAERAVKVLKELQELLGELHDVHVLAEVLEEAQLDAAAEGAHRLHAAVYDGSAGRMPDDAAGTSRAGLLAIDVLVRERRDELFAKLEAAWLGGRAERLWDAVEAEAAALAGRAGAPPREGARPSARR